MVCTHCNGTGKCKESELKEAFYEVWYECELCGSSEHIKYGGFFKTPNIFVKAKAKNNKIYCKACGGKGS